MALEEYIPQYILTTENFGPKGVVTAEHWNELFNLLISQGNDSAHVLKDLITALPESFITKALIGAINGVAGLDASGKVPMAQLPLVNNLISVATVTLTLAGWNNCVQTVPVFNAQPYNVVLVSATPDCVTGYMDNLVTCTAQGVNTLTFTCATAPQTALTVNVIVIDLVV